MKLSVITTCYNSSEFIGETINAVLDQQVDFEFEYIVSDDSSSDDTLEIVKQIKKSHPKGDYIHVIEQDKNQGVMKNFFGAVLESSGEYIAFCDSDDVWSDPKKVTKQVEYLDRNKECALTYHGFINRINEDLDSYQLQQFDEPIDQVVMNPQTSTMMVRGVLRELVNENVVNEAQGPQNDQYLRFLLKDKGIFEPLEDIDPNVRVVRESSIFSTVNKLTKKQKALHSWQTFYKYHGHGKNQQYLIQKVKGFQSAVNWLEYEKAQSFGDLKRAMLFDIYSGVMIRKSISRLRTAFFKPLISMRNLVSQPQNS